MSTINKKLVDELSCEITYGYITKYNRDKIGLEKSHYNDAFVIAGGTNQKRCKVIKIKQKHKNNRKLQINRKGFKPSIRRKRYKYQPLDIVKIEDKEYFVKGIHSYGKQIKLLDKSGKIINKSVKKLDNYIFNQGSLILT